MAGNELQLWDGKKEIDKKIIVSYEVRLMTSQNS